MGAPKNFNDSARIAAPSASFPAAGRSLAAPRADAKQWGVSQLLFYKRTLNFNVTTDQLLTRTWDFTSGKFIIERVRAANSSGSLTTAQGTLYTAASKGGIALGATTQAYTALTAAGKGMDLTLNADALDELDADNLYFALTTAQGGAMTADLFVFGIPIPSTW